ncbi:hypothetical protein PG999_010915 [Apiospora kogelbergensis]|uniref:Ubiquitin 3 binding protein But2 C-terminal domain-containing protein n=1 Tax=Apiospora kogelbergensis TaxID=1337665 RepID=A0AAW0QFP1_9PEZI
MKTTAILAAYFAATALAVPTLEKRVQCPKNDAQPNGYLPTDPKDTVSPSLLLQISAKEPNKKYAASNTAEITPGDQCTIFNLDLPVKDTKNKVCNLVFDWPENPTASLSQRALAKKSKLSTMAMANTTRTTPACLCRRRSPLTMTPGNSYIINSAPCDLPANLTSVKVSGSLCSSDTHLRFDNGILGTCPIGFYVVLTDIKK